MQRVVLLAFASMAFASPVPEANPQLDLSALSPLIGGGSQDPFTALTQIGTSIFGGSGAGNPLEIIGSLLGGGSEAKKSDNPLGGLGALLGGGTSGGGGLGSLLGGLFGGGSSGGSSDGSGDSAFSALMGTLGTLTGIAGNGGSDGNPLGALAGLLGGGDSSPLGAITGLLGGNSGSNPLAALGGLFGGATSSTRPSPASPSPVSASASGGLAGLANLLGGSGGSELMSNIFGAPLDWNTIWGIIKSFPGPDLRPVQTLFEVPNIEKYVTYYLDFRNITGHILFGGSVPYGPAPEECKKYELIIARGTGEYGPYGFITGDPLLERVQKELPDTQGYAVQYPAGLDAESWQTGVKDVVQRLNTHSKKCPETKFALVGYSQGAMIMHVAVSHNETDPKVLREKVVGGAMFGDPYRTGGRLFRLLPMPGQPTSIPKFPALLDNKMKNICAASWQSTDPVCNDSESTSFNVVAHLTYNNKGNNYMKDTTDHLVKLFREQKG